MLKQNALIVVVAALGCAQESCAPARVRRSGRPAEAARLDVACRHAGHNRCRGQAGRFRIGVVFEVEKGCRLMVILGLLNILIFLLCATQALGRETLPQEFPAMRSALCDKPTDFIETF